MNPLIRSTRPAWALGALALATGCATQAPTALPAANELKAACAALAGQSIAAASIGLPTSGAKIASSTFVAATPRTVTGNTVQAAIPDHCKVLGSIAPVDPKAEDIGFQINLPLAWNRKALQYGGGGYNGSLVNGMTPLRDAQPDDELPITRGYVTLGTDSGHLASRYAPNAIGQFGMNDEMLVNYGYASYKKVHDVAVNVMRSFYRQAPQRFYYFGGSEGGREGLTMAQRFPADYDGVVSVVPVVQLSMLFQSYIPRVRPQFEGGWINREKVTRLARFVAQSCDSLDGLADGVVNNYLACQSKVDLQALRCTGGADTGNDCLSDAQLATVRAMQTPYVLPFPVANGLTTYPPSLFGHEATLEPVLPTMTRWVTGTAQPTPAIDASTSGQYWLYGGNFVRYFVMRDPNFDARTFDPARHQERLKQVSEIIDSSNPDLSAFFARGGKLIMRENMADLAQSPMAGIRYFEAMSARVGAAVAERSARLYASPASTHSGQAASMTTGAPVPTAVDLLDHLDRWAHQGTIPPDALTQTVKAALPPFTTLASRPLCRYPNYPHYAGGDAKLAASYECRPSRP